MSLKNVNRYCWLIDLFIRFAYAAVSDSKNHTAFATARLYIHCTWFTCNDLLRSIIIQLRSWVLATFLLFSRTVFGFATLSGHLEDGVLFILAPILCLVLIVALSICVWVVIIFLPIPWHRCFQEKLLASAVDSVSLEVYVFYLFEVGLVLSLLGEPA